MANPNDIRNTLEGVASLIGKILPVVEHLPDSFGKWVPPIKKAVQANEKLAASIGLAGSASKAMRGRLSAVDAVMVGFNAHTLTGRSALSTLGAVGALAFSKIVRSVKDARREARGFEQATTGAEQKLGKLNRSAARGSGGGGVGLGKLVAAVGGYRLLTMAAERFKAAFDLGGELTDLKSKTGIAADQMLILRQAGKDAGVEDVSAGVNKLQDSLISAVTNGAGPAAKALGVLKLQSRDLVKESPVDQMLAIGAALKQIKNPALRTNVVRDLFGKSGSDLLPLLDNAEGLNEAQRSLGKQATILRDNAEAFDGVSDRLGRAGLKLQGFFVGLAAQVLPLMDQATARLDALDLAGQGEKFGDGVRAAVDTLSGAFADPQTIVAPLEGYLKAGFLGAGNVLIATIKSAAANFPAMFMGLGGVFVGLQRVISGTLMQAFAGPIEFLTAAVQSAFERFAANAEGLRNKLTPGGTPENNKYLAEMRDFGKKRVALGNQLDAKYGIKIGQVNDRGALDAKAKEMAAFDEKAPKNPLAWRSTAEIQKANGSFVGGIGAQEVAAGQATLKAEVAGLFEQSAAAFKSLKVEDVLGAAEELGKANQKVNAIRKEGAKIVAAFVGTEGPAKAPLKVNPFAGFATASTSSSLRSTGLAAASMAGGLTGKGALDYSGVANLSKVSRQSPILSVSERRAFEDQRVAMGGQRTASTAGAFGVIRAGDSARRKDAEKERERERLKNENSVQRTNELLGGIHDFGRRTAEALED